MSKHIVEKETPDGRIEIQVGWDGPLQCYYFVVQKLDAPDFEESTDEPLLSNLYLDNFRKITIDDIRELMLSHNLKLPELLYQNVEKDRKNNTVNEITYY